MEATKTKSGKWTCCAYYKDFNGKIHRPRFTADRKKDAERMAAACSMEHKDDCKESLHAKKHKASITFAEAGRQFIDNRCAVLSPATVRGYESILRNNVNEILDIQITEINSEIIQKLVNGLSVAGKSPKTVRNVFGFVTAVLRAYCPETSLHIKLPQKRPPDLRVPTEDDLQKLLSAIRGSRMEIPVLLAAASSLRRSEICALDRSDIGDGWIKIDKALVKGPDNQFVIKATKTEAGSRTAYIPAEITDRIKAAVPAGRIVSMTPDMISTEFPRILANLNIPHFRFHDLRAYFAWIMHALNVPDKYVMQLGGWKDKATMQRIYQRTIENKVPSYAQAGVNYFEDMMKSAH